MLGNPLQSKLTGSRHTKAHNVHWRQGSAVYIDDLVTKSQQFAAQVLWQLYPNPLRSALANYGLFLYLLWNLTNNMSTQGEISDTFYSSNLLQTAVNLVGEAVENCEKAKVSRSALSILTNTPINSLMTQYNIGMLSSHSAKTVKNSSLS